jgi:hypothetical protein
MTDIFISYAREDRSRIEPLANFLEGLGWSVFWDRTIPAGKTWRQVIGEALRNARSVIVAWSQKSIESEWVQEEADRGLKRNVLIPILIDDVDPPLGFGIIQAADLVKWDPAQSSPEFEKLIADISIILGPPPKGGKERELTAEDKREQKQEEKSKRKEEERRKAGEDSQRLKIILTALLEAVANLEETVVKDTYSAVKTLICRKYGKKSKLAEALEQLEKSPDSAEGRAELAEQLKAAKADQDDSVVKAAQDLTAKIRALHGVQQNIKQTVSGNHNIFSGSGNVTVTLNGKDR